MSERKKDNIGATTWEQMFIHVCPTHFHTKAKKKKKKEMDQTTECKS